MRSQVSALCLPHHIYFSMYKLQLPKGIIKRKYLHIKGFLVQFSHTQLKVSTHWLILTGNSYQENIAFNAKSENIPVKLKKILSNRIQIKDWLFFLIWFLFLSFLYVLVLLVSNKREMMYPMTTNINNNIIILVGRLRYNKYFF